MNGVADPRAGDHGAILTIDLGAYAANWRRLRQRVGDAFCGAVVKADAYGLGIEQAVPSLYQAGCRHFFVAHLSEAIRLRASLPDPADIYVLNGLPAGSIGLYRRHGLRPVIGSRSEWDEWLQAGLGDGDFALHVDTGMNRLGFRLDEALVLIASGAFDRESPAIVMSHFVSSEQPDDPVNGEQIMRFEQAKTAFAARKTARNPLFSLANSSGHFLPQKPFHHLTRPGYALYGGNPCPGRPNPMHPVVALSAPIIQVLEIEAGENIGYNGIWQAKRRSRIATFSLGYADGIPRTARGDGGETGTGPAIALAGRILPCIGRISMDLMIADVTDLAPGQADRGSMVEMIGPTIDLDRAAAGFGTIGYELLTSLGKRHRRIYRPDPIAGA
jgi:alanine racemase